MTGFHFGARARIPVVALLGAGAGLVLAIIMLGAALGQGAQLFM
jgi:hypothetical protein